MVVIQWLRYSHCLRHVPENQDGAAGKQSVLNQREVQRHLPSTKQIQQRARNALDRRLLLAFACNPSAPQHRLNHLPPHGVERRLMKYAVTYTGLKPQDGQWAKSHSVRAIAVSHLFQVLKLYLNEQEIPFYPVNVQYAGYPKSLRRERETKYVLLPGAAASSITVRLVFQTVLPEASFSSPPEAVTLSLLLLSDDVNRLAKHLQEPLLLHNVSGYPPDITSLHYITCLVPIVVLVPVATNHV